MPFLFYYYFCQPKGGSKSQKVSRLIHVDMSILTSLFFRTDRVSSHPSVPRLSLLPPMHVRNVTDSKCRAFTLLKTWMPMPFTHSSKQQTPAPSPPFGRKSRNACTIIVSMIPSPTVSKAPNPPSENHHFFYKI